MNNTKFCGGGDQSYLARIFHSDFSQTIENPLFLVTAYDYQLFVIIFVLCYAYTILRFVVWLAVLFYQKKRFFQYQLDRNKSSKEENMSSLASTLQEKKNLKREELEFYQLFIKIVCWGLEAVIAFRDFVLFRGLMMYSTDLYTQVYCGYSYNYVKHEHEEEKALVQSLRRRAQEAVAVPREPGGPDPDPQYD